jgi:HK97 family phage portal protein
LDLIQNRFAQTYFGLGARLGGVVMHPESLGDEAIRNIRESFHKQYSSPQNFHELLILEEGMKYEQFNVRADEAQFLESRSFSVEDIGRCFKIPPHLLGVLKESNYSNIEQMAREFITQTVTPWLVNFESAYALKLLKPEEWGSYYFQHDLSSNLRGDPETRLKSYALGIQNGIFSPNDCRRMENLDPRGPEGYLYLQPVNLAISPWDPAQAKPPAKDPAKSAA